MLALGIIVPILPKLIIEFRGGAAPKAATIYGIFGSVWAAMQFLFASLLGALSDRYGRRPVILLSTFGLGVDYLVMALAPTLGWLFLGRVLSGITASSFATGFAYVADVVPPAKRASRFGWLGVAFGLGFVLGPALGGILGGVALRLPFWAAAGLSFTGTAYGYFILPESLSPERRAPFNWRRANPIGSLHLLRANQALLGLAAAAFLARMGHDVAPSLFVLYGDYRYAWSERTVGLVLATVGVAAMLVQGGVVGPLVARLGERRTMMLGFAGGALGDVIFGLAPIGAVFLAGIPIGALFGLTNPSLQGLMTRRVRPDEQGRLQGSLASLMGIAGVIAPLLFTQVFARTAPPLGSHRTGLPGAAFWIAALLLLLALAIGRRSTRDPAPPSRP